ncbi:MAG: glycosyltransferase family 4 protein [Phycisphaerae bacterium]|nr:glycosyltransferase family 4 protein [Phycisphaerae bacterium]
MTTILHVVDRSCGPSTLQALNLLRSRLATATPSAVATIDPASRRTAEIFVSGGIVPAPRLLPTRFVNFASGLAKFAKSCRAEVIHAWGIEAAAVCMTTLPNRPLLITLIEPESAEDAAKWIRSFPIGAGVVADSEFIQSRLVTSGLDMGQVIVIRGAVDLGAINKARRDDVRRRIVGDSGPVILIPGPPERGAGQEAAIWAAGIIQFLHRNLRVLMPYASTEADRLIRWVRTMGLGHMLIVPDARLTWHELVTCADVFLQPAEREVCTPPIAAAMAAGLPIVATAIRSIAEMIADRHNGLLVRKAEPKAVAARLLAAIEDQPLVRQITDVARSQAFEIFSPRASADNYRRVYENLAAGRPIGEGINDTARVA